MRLKLFDTVIIIDFSFVLIISLALLFGAGGLLRLLLFSGLHELGHLAALAICKKRTDSLRLSFYGAALKYSASLSKGRECFVLLCGPLVNLLLFLFLKDEINISLFILNLLPIYPLDGGRALRLFLPRVSDYVSYVFLAVFIAFSLYLIACHKVYSMLLISVYLLVYTALY